MKKPPECHLDAATGAHKTIRPGLRCPACETVPNPISPMIVSAPTGEDLMPSPEEQANFERLVRWQEESKRSPIKLGGSQ